MGEHQKDLTGLTSATAFNSSAPRPNRLEDFSSAFVAPDQHDAFEDGMIQYKAGTHRNSGHEM